MSTIIPPSQLIDSIFTTSNITGAVGSSVNPGIATRANGSIDPTLNVGYKNTIYHNKRTFTQTIKCTDRNTFTEVIEREWRIPFTVDDNLPVSEITERIDNAMDKIGLYTYWKINYNDYTISAYVRVTEDKI